MSPANYASSVVKRAAVFIGALVGHQAQKLTKKIPVCAVNLDRINACFDGQLGVEGLVGSVAAPPLLAGVKYGRSS